MAITLPTTFSWTDFTGTQKEYLVQLYEIFTHDFYANQVIFLGHRVLPQKDPMTDERVWAFNHITKYETLSPTHLDYNRSKKIPWIAPILNGCPDSCIKAWQTEMKYRGKWVTRVHVWYEAMHFEIILQEKGNVYYLITAITKSDPRDDIKLNDEYKNSTQLV